MANNELSNGYKKTLVLFDLDGTLTIPRKLIKDDMKNIVNLLRLKHHIGIVSGSDLSKLLEQMGGKETLGLFNYILPENGIIAYKGNEKIFEYSIQKQLGDEKLQIFINYVLEYLSKIWLPIKRGTFIEFRQGLINIAPPGRNCNPQEREDFEKYDKVHQVRATMVNDLKKKFENFDLVYSIGGQISFDVFPHGWDKSFCLQHFNEYENIYFFGDKTMKGGNDYEIFNHERTKAYTVEGPEDTQKKLKEIFNL